MNGYEKLVKIGGLIESVEKKSRPFFAKCSHTKLLAYSEPDKAKNEYLHLARQAFQSSGSSIDFGEPCKRKIRLVQSVLNSETLDINFVIALQSLRSSFLQEVLRPAIRSYITDKSRSQREIENLFTSVLRIDGLVEIGQLIDKIDS